MNVALSDQHWAQASLPVSDGGLGLRRVASLAPSAFLASVACTRPLQDLILYKFSDISAYVDSAIMACKQPVSRCRAPPTQPPTIRTHGTDIVYSPILQPCILPPATRETKPGCTP